MHYSTSALKWLFAVAVFAVSLVSPALAIGPRITPSPHDDAHLVIVRPNDLLTAEKKPAGLVEDLRASFSEKTAPVRSPLAGSLRVRHSGKYVVWVRLSQTKGKQAPVKVELRSGEKSLLAGSVNGDEGAAGTGGPKGYAAYLANAKQNTPKGAVASLESQRFEVGKEQEKEKPSGSDDLGDDLLEELREKPADPWAHLARVDEIEDKQPAYWWKVGEVKLEPGRYQLHLSPDGPVGKKLEESPRFDAAMLSTVDKLEYPSAGDIDEPKATFVRFRLDKLPKDGLRLGADFQTHVLQQPRLSTRFGRDVIGKDDLFTKPGFTCWYRLQDVRYMPEATQHEIGVRISVNASGGINIPAKNFDGATQFASFPHQDYIVREFDWSEPLGLNYTCALDVENYPHRLMTFRDHAREHYLTALNAAKRISPLTRGELYFTTIAGAFDDNDRDYMRKTIRLLGINSFCESGDQASGRKLFGWNTAFFAATMPLGDLFDAEKARKTYDDYFAPMFKTDVEGWKDTWSFCYMDEPGELYREEMTGPFWQYIDDPNDETDEPYWFDPVGNSALHIKRPDLPDCVLEGVIERNATIEFRVAMDDLEQPNKYTLWAIGYPLGPAINSNLGFGKYVEGAVVPAVGYRMVRSMGAAQGKLKFKIVYQNGTATLFINDRTIHQHVNLPKEPRFGIAGGPKKIYALRLRPLKAGEGVTLEGEKEAETNDSAAEAAELGQAVLEELELDDLPAWARPKDLKKFVEDECLYAGGVPGVGPAFRKWLKEQGLTPEFFGRKSWDEIRPLTLQSLVKGKDDSRLYYWSRRFSSQLTPRNFGLISESIHRLAPNKKMWSYAALSGGVIYRARQMPLDMFHVGGLGNTATGGISDWMFYSSWRWDSHQIVAYSAELYNAGARRHGARPVSFPMMHCVSPSTFRAFTMLGGQVKLMSLYSYGPRYLDFPDSWAEGAEPYDAIARLTARTAPADDILAPGVRRPSRVALLYPHSSEYWSTNDSFDDRRGTFLALSHEYYQPEVVTEQQVIDGALEHYDALYVVDRHVAGAAQKKIGEWVSNGKLLWTCADALTRDEYDQPADLLASLAAIKRTWADDAYAEKPTIPGSLGKLGPRIVPVDLKTCLPHDVLAAGVPTTIELPPAAKVGAKYKDGRPAWGMLPLGKGRVCYVGHRAGATYTQKNILVDGHRELWSDTGRELLTAPLRNKVERELDLSQTAIMASPISSQVGTAVVLYNMRPSPRQGLIINLREPKEPARVAHLVDGKLVDLKCEYVDGLAKIELPELVEEDIVYVWRETPAKDDRLDVMRKRTEEQLGSSDVESLSTGAWVAGFYPDWKLTDKIAPLAAHDDWRVRRAAAETLGRLKHTAAAESLAKLAKEESDPHVLAEQLAALVKLEYAGLAEICEPYVADARFVVRQAALRGLADDLLGDVSKQDVSKRAAKAKSPVGALARKAALAASIDHDQRVRVEAMRILAFLEPEAAAKLALAAFASDEIPAMIDRPLWAAAIAREDAAWQALVAQQKEFGLPMALELGKVRRDAGLAAQLARDAAKLTPEQAYNWSLAMIHQRDPEAARAVFAQRDKLPERVQYYVPILLEYTFETGLGNVLADWDKYLHPIGQASMK